MKNIGHRAHLEQNAIVPVYFDYRRSKQQNSPCSRNARAYSKRVMGHPQLLPRVLRTVPECMIDLRHIYNVANWAIL